MHDTYTISSLSQQFDITPRTLRFYEHKGILDPQRRGQTRVYTERDKTRLKLTLRGKRLGLSLEECREIIDMYDPDRPNDTRQLLRLCQKIREHRAQLIEKLKDIEETLKAMDEVEQKCLGQVVNNTA
jgi:DNA-binding transcriptional MerR regulator